MIGDVVALKLVQAVEASPLTSVFVVVAVGTEVPVSLAAALIFVGVGAEKWWKRFLVAVAFVDRMGRERCSGDAEKVELAASRLQVLI